MVVLTDHVSKSGEPKLVKECNLPLTGVNVVKRVITDLASFDAGEGHLILRRLAPGVTLEEIEEKTEAAYTVDLVEPAS